MKLAVGPLLYLWDRSRIDRFYESVRDAPVDIVYLGETVCSKRRVYRTADWLALAERLQASGKEVVLSTLALIEAESELAQATRIAATDRYAVECNDLAAVAARDGRPFVIGPHVNVYNGRALAFFAAQGAHRWVAPLELDLATIGQIASDRPSGLELELFAYGRMPLSVSARCFTARAHERPKDDCGFVCGDYPEGLTTCTRDDQPFLTLNGVQVQSAHTHNAIEWVPQARDAGVDVLRLSPVPEGFFGVVEAFRRAAEGAAARLEPGVRRYCDGYLRGGAGMTLSQPSARD